MSGTNGDLVHESTGFTVSMWAFNSKVGLLLSKSSETIQILLASLLYSKPQSTINLVKTLAAFSSSLLIEGVEINAFSISTAIAQKISALIERQTGHTPIANMEAMYGILAVAAGVAVLVFLISWAVGFRIALQSDGAQ